MGEGKKEKKIVIKIVAIMMGWEPNWRVDVQVCTCQVDKKELVISCENEMLINDLSNW